MRLVIEIKNLTKAKHNTLKSYTEAATEFINLINKRDKSNTIESIGFELHRIKQSLETIQRVVDDTEGT